jgi:Cu/Ag efflux pump CusA
MARITRPLAEAMPGIRGALTVQAATGHGRAEVNVFFTWKVDRVQFKRHVLSRRSMIRNILPAGATVRVQQPTIPALSLHR